ncbi:MAG: LacI family transcriptional regulator [Sporolactobacillus sp.]|jgi:LacI family transcriptional regulator|nr:LacI family transcriptional regulator [Sporolactobacillus sp.]
MKKRLSIKDIAQISGVSVATVSRVINNSPKVTSKTREKVLSVIKNKGYERDRNALGLRSHYTHMIGVLVPDITNLFFASIVKTCEQYLFRHGYSTIVCNTDRDPNTENKYLKVLNSHLIDGLIIISSHNKIINNENVISLPAVYIDHKPNIKAPMISSDHYKGAEMAIEYLLSKKADPWMVITPTKSTATLERIRGFKETLIKHHIDLDGKIIVLESTSDNYLKRSAIADQFLKQLSHNNHVNGIFSVNDNIAYSMLQTALSLNISVPSQLKIIGFDDSPIAKIARPSITTIHQDYQQIAYKACDILLNDLSHQENTKLQEMTIRVPVKLVLRSTT